MTNNNTPSLKNHPLGGRSLSRLLRARSPQARAAVAAALVRQGQTIGGLLPVQAAKLCDVSSTAVSIALGRAGTRGPRASTVDKLVKRYGDTLMQALDRATAPQRVAAE